MSTEPNKSEFLPRLRIPKIPNEDTKGEFLPRLRYPKFPDDPPASGREDFARTLESELAAEQARTVELSKEVGWLRDELDRLHTAIKEGKL